MLESQNQSDIFINNSKCYILEKTKLDCHTILDSNKIDNLKLKEDFKVFINRYFLEKTDIYLDQFDVQKYIIEKIGQDNSGDFTCDSFADESILKSEQYKEGLILFYSSLVDFIKNQIRTFGFDKSKNFITRIDESMFSYSPNLFTEILDPIYVANLVHNIPEISRMNFYGSMQGEVSLVMDGFYQSEFTIQANRLFEGKNDSEIIDILYLLFENSKNSRFSGFSGVDVHIEKLVKYLLEQDKNPLIKHMLKSFLEEDNYLYNSDKNLLNNNKTLRKEKIPGLDKGILLDMTHLVLQVASDSYVAYDIKFKPIAFSNGDLSEFMYFDEIETNNNISGNLIQNLHQIKSKLFFEKEFNIDLTKVSLKSQIQLLNFLYKKSQKEVEQIKIILNNNELIKYSILESFLALSENEKISEDILNIASSSITVEIKERIFNKYNDLTSTILEEIDNLGNEIDGLDKGILLKQIISRLNLFLKDIGDLLESGNDNNILKIEEILENTKKEIIKSGLIFKNIKDKNIEGLEDLNKAGIEYKKIMLSEIDEEHKIKLKNELFSLYKENYDNNTQGKFLSEINHGLDNLMRGDSIVEFYIFYIDGEPILSSYFKQQEDGSNYWGGFNAKGVFQEYGFGFWVFEKILKEKNNVNVNFTVTTEIEGVENRRFKMLLRMYKKFGFIDKGEGKTKYSSYKTMSNSSL